MEDIIVVVGDVSQVVLSDYKGTRKSHPFTYFDVENTIYHSSFPCQKDRVYKTPIFNVIKSKYAPGTISAEIASVIPKVGHCYYEPLFFNMKTIKGLIDKYNTAFNPQGRICLNREECFILYSLFSLSDKEFASKEQLLPLLKKAIDLYGYLFISNDKNIYHAEFTLPLLNKEEVKIEGYTLL